MIEQAIEKLGMGLLLAVSREGEEAMLLEAWRRLPADQELGSGQTGHGRDASIEGFCAFVLVQFERMEVFHA